MAINIVGIKDSANFTVKRKSTGKTALYADYATTSLNEWKSDQVYAMSKSTRAIRWDYNKQSTVKATLEIFDLKWVSLLSGSDFIEGSKDILVREVLTVGSSNTVTLTDIPTTGSLEIYLLDDDMLTNKDEQLVGTPATTPNKYSILAKDITFNETTCPEGTKVVAYYLKASESTAKCMTISANAFPYTVELYLDTMIRDTDGNDKFVQLFYPNAKAKGNFTLTLSASEITKLEVEFDILKASDSDTMSTYTIL